MKFAEKVSSFLKSLGGGTDEEKKKEGDEKAEDDINLDDPDGDTSGEGDDDDDGMEKSELADATVIMTALVDELQTLNKSMEAITKRQEGMEKSQTDLGEAVVGVAEMVAKIANSPNPVKAAMTKSLQGAGAAPATGSGEVLTRREFEQAQRALAKSFAEKKISLFQSTRLESEMQKAMTIVGYQMTPEDRALIASALKTA